MRKFLLKTRGQRRIRLRKEIAQQLIMIDEARARITSSKIVVPITPLAGLEWFLAVTLWFFNATCWTAWFGTASHMPSKAGMIDIDNGDPDRAQYLDGDTVAAWLSCYECTQPTHCAQLFESYKSRCGDHGLQALSERKFYQRLIAFGARKFRDGHNGPTKYQLPRTQLVNTKVKL